MTSLGRHFSAPSFLAVGARQSRPSRGRSTRPAISPVGAPVVCTAATSRSRGRGSVQHLPNTVPVTFSIQLEVPFGDHLRLVGNGPALGNWKVDTAPRLEWSEGNVWTVTLDCVPLKPLEFKFVHVKRDGTQVWENCGNRQFTPVVLGVSSEWNQPVVQALPSAFAAELEARALVVQAVEVLELLDSALEFTPNEAARKGEVAAAGAPAQQQAQQAQQAQDWEEQQELELQLELLQEEQEVAAALQAAAASEEAPAVAGIIPAPQLAEYAEALVQAAAAFQQAGLLRLNGTLGAAAPAAGVAPEPALAEAAELVDVEVAMQHTVDAAPPADVATVELAAAAVELPSAAEPAAAGQPLAPADTEEEGEEEGSAAIQELPAPEAAASTAAAAPEDAGSPSDLEAEFQAASAGMAVLLPEGDAPVPNGAAPNSTGPHGAVLDGEGFNGAVLDGEGLNGALLNGAAANGAVVNGTTPANGVAHDSDAAASTALAVALQVHKAGTAVEGKAASTGGRRGYSTEYQRYLAESEGAARWEELLEGMRSGRS